MNKPKKTRSRGPLDTWAVAWLRRRIQEDGPDVTAARLGVTRTAVVTAASGASMLQGSRLTLELAIKSAMESAKQ